MLKGWQGTAVSSAHTCGLVNARLLGIYLSKPPHSPPPPRTQFPRTQPGGPQAGPNRKHSHAQDVYTTWLHTAITPLPDFTGLSWTCRNRLHSEPEEVESGHAAHPAHCAPSLCPPRTRHSRRVAEIPLRIPPPTTITRTTIKLPRRIGGEHLVCAALSAAPAYSGTPSQRAF